MKAERGEEAAEEKLEDICTHFIKFKERIHLHNIKVQGEAAGAAVEPVASYPEDGAQITHECGYTLQQTFSGDETALNWKMSCSTFKGRDEKSMLGFETSKDRLTLVRG